MVTEVHVVSGDGAQWYNSRGDDDGGDEAYLETAVVPIEW